MQKVLFSIDTINEYVGRVFRWSIILLCAVMMLEVVTRYIFHRPTIWAFEVSTGLYATTFMMCGAYALLYKSHVTIDIIYEMLTLKGRSILDVLTHIIFFYPFLAVLLIHGTKFAHEAWKIKETHWGVFPMPLYLVKTMIPIFAVLTLLQGTATFIRSILALTTGKIYEPKYKKDNVQQVVEDVKEELRITDKTPECAPAAVVQNAADQGSSKKATIGIIIRFLIVILIVVIFIMLGI